MVKKKIKAKLVSTTTPKEQYEKAQSDPVVGRTMPKEQYERMQSARLTWEMRQGLKAEAERDPEWAKTVLSYPPDNPARILLEDALNNSI